MLRITLNETPTEQQWTLQGRLVGPWAAQLRTCWDDSQAARQGRSCVVDVTNLTSVDESGEQVLRTMIREGAKFRACGVYTAHLLKSLGQRCRRGGH
jgi:hypothetical protein